jgi:hypothetical protein
VTPFPFLLPWFEALQAWSWGTQVRESTLGYPVVETAHVFSIVLFAGFVVMMDLRLVGLAFRDTRFSYLQARLFPWQMVGMALSAVTGGLLFTIDPMRFYDNIFFWFKVALLAFAGINAVLFHMTTYRSVAGWDTSAAVPYRARIAGAASLALWACVIVTGRLIAYNWFK